ncbi:DUF3040 domain-containing protein [Geodermatophilus sp. YIM 151500]|uniref:DUF3040 domain-containing protein n=1 Tax=Geodermatophilus sp. YIM 151500 TaxID=2984531 RepID=UPI0021E4F1AF|nr:DUF3040 domain-containing protein [Geodermatophilus sp. YIM 151500]MCV2488404.1 DUF3040 domain-containing protein [Geodermatophilus sp. YIM 151500]
MPLDPEEREALAGIRSGLEREDRALADSFAVLSAPPTRRWALLACAAVVAAALLFAALGVRAVAVIGMVLVLAAPWVAFRAANLAADDAPPGGMPPTGTGPAGPARPVRDRPSTEDRPSTADLRPAAGDPLTGASPPIAHGRRSGQSPPVASHGRTGAAPAPVGKLGRRRGRPRRRAAATGTRPG